MKKWIEFRLGTEKQIKISQAGRSGSLFYEGYRQGLAGVIEIVRASTYYTQQCDCFSYRNGAEKGSHGSWYGQQEGPRTTRYDQQEERRAVHSYGEYYGAAEDKDFYNYPNNMIVFTGGRGTGKSSAMLTFVDSLTRPDSLIFQRKFLSDVVKCELPGTVNESDADSAVNLVHGLLSRCTFLRLSPIDPTTLEEDGQILVNILARMFQKAEEIWDQNNRAHRNDLNEKNELMRQFTTCYEYACAIKQRGNKRDEFDGLDVLSSLGDSSNLKRQMALLVKKLLHFAAPNAGEDSYLVLQIDDTDMNIQQAYSILEDIRKYLLIPRLIIVMAADIEHLSQVVESSLLRGYADRTSVNVHGIASQYISKLFPQSRRICLPELGVYLKEHPDTDILYKVGETSLLPDKSHFHDSQEQIFRLIYQKTGMIFLRRENHLHYIIPDNMRLLGHFLAMLVQMQTVTSPEIRDPQFFLADGGSREEHWALLQTRLQNVQRFRDYFLGTWASNALTEEHAQYLRELSTANLPNKVRIVCSKLGSPESSTYADMIRLLREKDRAAATDAEKRYYFAIHTYFSMLAHSIVLEELVDHYKEDGALRYCVFKRLYPVFGSRIFPYAAEQNVMVKLRDIQKPLERELVQILWQAPEKMDRPSALTHKPQNPRFLYSMLCPYTPPDEKTDIWADFTTPIVNCLYLSPAEYISPLSERAVADDAHTSGMTTDTWGDMQSAALLVLLNWDVQQILGARVLGSIVPTNPQSGEEKGDMIVNLGAFYRFLVKPFQDEKTDLPSAVAEDFDEDESDKKIKHQILANGQTKSNEIEQAKDLLTDRSRFAIACLDNMDLALWLRPLTRELLEPEQQAWEDVVNRFYSAFPDKEPGKLPQRRAIRLQQNKSKRRPQTKAKMPPAENAKASPDKDAGTLSEDKNTEPSVAESEVPPEDETEASLEEKTDEQSEENAGESSPSDGQDS